MIDLAAARELSFGPFVLEVENARLLRDKRAVALTPKALNVLHHLATRPDRLVTKNELMSAVWADVLVSDASIKVCVREIRKALKDIASKPTYIETVHRRGYRFIAPVVAGGAEHNNNSRRETVGQLASVASSAANPAAAITQVSRPSRHPFVGRAAQMRKLRELFDAAALGRRQCVFVSGEAGSGKTALVEAFARSLAVDGCSTSPVVLFGQCFEQFGAGEPYMPVWEAIGRRPCETDSAPMSKLLARHAAAYVPPPALTRSTVQEPVSPLPSSGGSDRLVREMAEAVESLAANVPLVVVLEDMQWADYSTIDLISALARRVGPAKLMVIATYRPTEIAATPSEHPLNGIVRGLSAAGRCCEIALDYLEEPAVGEFLAERFPGGQFPAELTRRLQQRTNGCPLFLVQLTDDLVDQGVVTEQDGQWQLAGADDALQAGEHEIPGWLAVLETQVPRSVRAMVEAQVQRLDGEARDVLEAAAVAGVEFSAAAVGAVIGADAVEAERVCEDLARRHRFLEKRGHDEWPDGTLATHYRFAHELHHSVVYEQVPIARRARLHQRMGLRMEAAWGARAPEEAANLGMHFEAGRDWPRALNYFRIAAHAANRQYAHREAVHHLRRALVAAERLAPAERERNELDVLNSLGMNLQVTRGFASPEVEAIHARAHALCMTRTDCAEGDLARTFQVLWGIWLFHKVRSELGAASDLCGELFTMAGNDPVLRLQAHQAMCVTHLCRGNPLITWEHMEKAAAIYDPRRHHGNTELFGQDPGVATAAFGAIALWLVGRADDAIGASQHAIELAEKLKQPSSLALAMHFATMLHQFRGDVAQTTHWADRAIALAEEEGFSFWRAGGLVLRGWATAAHATATSDNAQTQAGIEDINRGLEAWLATGSRTYHTYYLGLLADALQRARRFTEAQHTLDEAIALTRSLSEGLYEAELYRLKGNGILSMTSGKSFPQEAQLCLVKARSVARAQSSRSFEDRAEADLAKLVRQREKLRSLPGLLTQDHVAQDSVSDQNLVTQA